MFFFVLFECFLLFLADSASYLPRTSRCPCLYHGPYLYPLLYSDFCDIFCILKKLFQKFYFQFDCLLNKRQDIRVIYRIVEWQIQDNSLLTVVAIANTLDFFEKKKLFSRMVTTVFIIFSLACFGIMS